MASRQILSVCLVGALSCAEEPSPPVEPTITWIDPGYSVSWPATWAGVVSLDAGVWDYGKPQLTSDFAAFVQVGTPGDDRVLLVQVVVHDPLEGLDDCGLTEEIEGTQNIEPEEPRKRQDAGEVSIGMPGSQVWPMYEMSRGRYTADLSVYGIEPSYGGTYEFSATGDVFPAFEVSMVLPEELILTAPDHGATLENPLPLQWTGSSDGVVELEISVYPSSGSFGGTYRLTCMLVDDGEYTIQPDLVERLPSDADTVAVGWEFRRATLQEVTLPGGQVMGLVAEAAANLMP
jgi:hypothetical protein